MRRNRIIWLGLFILSLVGISYYGGAISYGFFYAMIFTPLVSLLYLLYVYVFFRIYQYNDGRTFVADDPVPYSFRLINEYHLPFAGIRVRFYSPFSTVNDLSDKTEYELVPNTGITRETTIVCHYRGEYEIGIKEVEIQDYFRLFRIKYVNKEPKRVIVNPKKVFIKNLTGYEIQAKDAPLNASKPDIVTREYVQGDDIRFINWGQTARTGNLMTRNRIGEEGNGISIIADTCRYSDDPYVYLPSENKILELTIAMSLFFGSRNIATKEYLYYRQLLRYVIDNVKQFDESYKVLSSIHFDSESTQKKLFESLMGSDEIFRSSAVYMVLPKWSEYAGQMVDKLSKRGISTVVYLINNDSEEKIHVVRTDMVKVIHISPEAKLEEVFS